jgi:hypothetical protein
MLRAPVVATPDTTGCHRRFLGCAQSKGWPEDVFKQCNNYDSWVVVVISILPPLARLLQCLQRWRESRVGIQLINVRPS